MSAAAWSTPLLRAQPSIAAAMALRSGTLHSAAEALATTPPASLEDALHAAFSSADIVFTGEVTGIRQTDGAVIVSWRVEDAVRGAQAGSTYDLREWAGLWQANGARYLVGQRALVMLHAPSVAGYASPVAGGDGIVPLRGGARDGVFDLRMLAQHAVVTDAARLRPARMLKGAGSPTASSEGFPARGAVLASSGQLPGPRANTLRRAPEEDASAVLAEAEGTAAVSAATPSTAASVDGAMVLGMLRAWQRGSVAAK